MEAPVVGHWQQCEERTIPADSPEALPEPEASIGEVCPINDGINAGWQLIKDRWARVKASEPSASEPDEDCFL